MEEKKDYGRVVGSDFLIHLQSIREGIKLRKKVIAVEFWSTSGELNIDLPSGSALLILRFCDSMDPASDGLLRVEVPAAISVAGTIYKPEAYVGKHLFNDVDGDNTLPDPFLPKWVFDTEFDVKLSPGGNGITNPEEQTVTVPIKLKYILGLMSCLESDWIEPQPT